MIHGNREQEGEKSDFESEDKFEYRKHKKKSKGSFQANKAQHIIKLKLRLRLGALQCV